MDEIEGDTQEVWEDLLNHVILPRVLPQNKPPRFIELKLMHHMVENVKNSSDFLPVKTVDFFKRFQKIHSKVQCEPDVVSKEINSLRPGDTFAMFVRRQNTTFMVYMLPKEDKKSQKVILSTFPGNLHPSKIYEAESDIEFSYPVQAIKTKYSRMLRSEELAKQLCFLFEELPIETQDRNYVSKWLFTLLAHEKSETASTEEFRFITKKIRDEVWGKDRKNYFRRSSFYTSVKVLLQHSLTMQLGPEMGKFYYKTTMLRFLTRMCKFYTEPTDMMVNNELLSQLIAKMSRRIEKLLPMAQTITGIASDLYLAIVDEAKKCIKHASDEIIGQIQSIQQMDEQKSQLQPLTDLNFDMDICHKMPKTLQYLRKRVQHVQQVSKKDNGSKYKVKSYQRYYTEKRPGTETIAIPTDVLECRIYWIEFENLFLYQVEMNDDQWTANELRNFFFKYATYASKEYNGNQLSTSKLILVLIKIIAVLDGRCLSEFPLLRKHRNGIDPNVINALLIPQRADMEVAFNLEKYFRHRSNEPHPGLTEEGTISANSFSVNFAMQNSQMLQVRKQILELDERNIEHKKSELKNGRERVENLRDKASKLDHHYFYNQWGNHTHSNLNYCDKCRLTDEAEKMSIEQYEHLLPEEEFKQLAISFELHLPNSIACLRDILYGFINLCTKDSEHTRSYQIILNWTARSQLSEYVRSESTYVTLSSTERTNLSKYHVSFSIEKFIVKNGSNCVLFAEKKSLPTSLPANAIKNVCTFKTLGEYLDLQWTLNITMHTQNEVLSRQSECSHNMSLPEFKNFGSLRADGHRLQLRKLYAMIETEALSFEKESVLVLIMQTLWECGVSGDDNSIRESFVDFNEPEFCTAMIELLTKYTEQQKDNWVHPLKLVMTTLIVIRAFEINGNASLVSPYVRLLTYIRTIALNWIDEIKENISNMQNVDTKNERDLRLKLIFVVIAGSLTFFVHPTHKFYENIFATESGPSAAQLWLQFIITLNNNVHLYESNESKLSSNLRLFIRMIECNGVYLEPKMKTMINPEVAINLMKKQWSRAATATFMKIYYPKNYPHILAADVVADQRLQTITIDIITGAFSVDGLSVSRLPNESIQDKNYQWFFGQTTFPVQPDAENNFCTLQRYNNSSYIFRKDESDENHQIITEQTNEGLEKELLPFYILRGDFPHLLTSNYSHWWNKQENCIEFRLKSFGQKHFSEETTIDYRLDLATKHLTHVKTNRPMVDIRSSSYIRIVDQLSRLEHSDYIHVLINDPSNDHQEVIVELIRMNLKFKIDCSKISQKQYDLISNEFIGMRIAQTQKTGTLYGVNHGLILESASNDSNSKTKKLLIPHGTIKIESNRLHVSVDIDIGPSLRKPRFYEYEVDEFCKQLKSNNSSHASWFYLAYLHAITSHGEVEPFTGMSGTERALQILQSAFAWSSSPYEPEAIIILNDIAKLTPIRKLVDNKEVIKWPNNIPHRSARDSFIFIVKTLLENSQRLHKLYFKKSVETLDIKTNFDLNKREYWRCLQMNPNLGVSDTFIEHRTLRTSAASEIQTSLCLNTQAVSTLYHSRKYFVPENLDLTTFLTGSGEVLIGLANKQRVTSLLIHSKYDPVSNWWISLYDAARKQQLNQEQITLILTLFLVCKEEKCEPILALQAVALNPDAFIGINPPPVDQFQLSARNYDADKVANLLRSHCSYSKLIQIVEDLGDTNLNHEILAKELIEVLKENVTTKWPCDSVILSKSWIRGRKEFEFEFNGANEEINQLLTIWNNNRKLELFIKEVEERLKSLPLQTHKLPYYSPFLKAVPQNWPKFQINFDKKLLTNLCTHEATILDNEAKDAWNMKRNSKRSADQWWNIITGIFNSKNTLHLIESGLFPRLVPALLLPKIINTETDDRLTALIGAWAIAIAHEQREKRIQVYQRPELIGLLNREQENIPHSNWKPCDRPEWLIFEIEQNLTIRPIQIETANQMIDPLEKDGVRAKHSVMQLNMGEGKTAVIVPISAAVLANGTQACQITLLKSLFATNLKSLRQYLGGMLNRRIYTLPCRRDMQIEQHVDDMLNIYEECKTEKGVILTLPEYRLSFQLKIYESIQKGHIRVAKKFLDVHKWINSNVRNILDESDAILQPKYQLIYTVGNQLSPDGGFERWFVSQALLKRVPFHMKKLYSKYGKDKIEFNEKYVENGHVFGAPKVNYRSDIFTPCRILDETIFDDLKAALVEDFFEGRLHIAFSIDPSTKDDLKYLLTHKEIDKKTLIMIENFPLKERNTIMILSGLLRFEVLKLVLTRRWRVNYGVDKTHKGRRKMAIPFKAKDVAAEMTEFGHPDAAICFTQLSYYYSGLDTDQLYQVFDILENESGSSSIYEKWIQSIAPELRESSIVSYTGVNLDDRNQRDRLLFPLLSHNMHVIDFWLSTVVFKHEARTFEQKLMCSAWDLCSDQLEHRVTGFSGTNDTKRILPMPIAQNDLKKLENTNEIMREILLKPENRLYVALPANVSGKEILDKLIEKGIPVLLDSGALMLELTNEEVAMQWLSKAEPKYEASVYFDENDVLQTIDRKGIKTEFDYSVYRENLARCLVYLDDSHTRGTDLKFPPEWKACVTLSGDMTRDKTVQSCMRLRQLGKGQSISFWASYDADVRIRKTCKLSRKNSVKNEHVIEFISRNSDQFVTTNMVHWTASAINYTKKLFAHKLYENESDKESMEKLYDICVDDEFAKLSEMYGDKKESLLTDVAWAKFDKLATKFKRNQQIQPLIRQTQTDVLKRLDDLAPNMKQFSNALDEEQEKELEQEKEEQRSVERPPSVKPAEPFFNEYLKHLILNGVTGIIDDKFKNVYTLLSVGASLERTKLSNLCEGIENAWDSHLFVTKDYQTVLGIPSRACDEFLRPVWWIARIENGFGKHILVLLSSYECDRLMPTFRKSLKSALISYRPRISKLHSNLVHNKRLQVTKMPKNHTIDVQDEVQFEVYSGAMYFSSDAEQNAYCGFLGLIPSPRKPEQERAFEEGVIELKGFVPLKKRQYSAISDYVGQCKFKENPVDFAIKIIEAHHQVVLKESHVFSVFQRGIKLSIENDN